MKIKVIIKCLWVLVLLFCPGIILFAIDYIDILPESVSVRRLTLNDRDQLENEFEITELLFISDPDMVFDKSTASSSLPEDKYGRYNISQALDGSLQTAWGEGKKGPGKGEYIFCVLKPHDYLYIFPGYGSSKKVWSLNNRLKKANITVYGLKLYTTTGAPEIGFNPMAEEFVVTFEDTYAYHGFYVGRYLFNVSKWHPGTNFLFVIIEIVDVYKGSKYDDTCIAEVMTAGRVAPDPSEFEF